MPVIATPSCVRLTVAGFLANAVSLGVILSFSSQQQLYAVDDTQSLSALWFVWLPCLQWTTLHGASLIPDRFWQPGLPIIAGGSLLCVLARVGASFAQSYTSGLLLEGLLTGAAFAMICVPLAKRLAVAATLAPKSSAMSGPLCHAVTSSGALAGAVLWSVLKQALPGAHGVQWLHRVIAIVSGVFLVAAIAAAWCWPVDAAECDTPSTASFAASQAPQTRQPLLWRLATLLAVFSIYAGNAVMPLFLTSFAVDRGMSESASSTVQTIFYLCGAVGHGACGLAERQLESKYILAAAAAISGLFGLAMPVAVQPAVVYVYFALLGLLLGYMVARPPSYFAQSLFCDGDEWAATVASCAGFCFGAALCGFVQDSTDRGWFSGGFVSAGGLLGGSFALVILLGAEPRLTKADFC